VSNELSSKDLLNDVRALIAAAEAQVAVALNSTLVALYWRIGQRIREDVLGRERAEYGGQVIRSLAKTLSAEFGRGFSARNLFRMVQFAEVIPDEDIVSSLMTQLTWTHIVHLVTIDDPLKRDFYIQLCRVERWSGRTLRDKMQRLTYERTALSRKPEEVIEKELANLRETDVLTPDLVFRDPYFLDFLGLTGLYDEKDIEQAILRELEAFILELGSDFAFLARKKRISIDSEDYYLDLLFFHRGLNRLVAIDLKLGKFQAADKGQMELYLRWLEKHEMRPTEAPPIGLILCADKSEEHVELLRLEESGIRVAQYLTELPPRELLVRKLHDSIIRARERLSAQSALRLPEP
jgi:predicted nuclease of restriction endonuclease-like (RecB) superfamily